MKMIVKLVSMVSLGMLLSVAACNSKSDSETQGTTDSTDMDNTQSEMQADTMATDSASRP